MATKKNTKSAPAKKAGRTAAFSRGEEDSDTDQASGATTEPQGPQECLPCRGVGTVISNLGGEPNAVTCPWCEGGGVRLTGMDAQSRWSAEQPEASGGGAEEASEEAA
ncbi:MAG TPA: hypothetical protein VLJ42_08725 [Solirubrobacteraceae bacterium]|nr:hypothetical protein [Solirubrobacteraceae bacterium]